MYDTRFGKESGIPMSGLRNRLTPSVYSSFLQLNRIQSTVSRYLFLFRSSLLFLKGPSSPPPSNFLPPVSSGGSFHSRSFVTFLTHKGTSSNLCGGTLHFLRRLH